MNVAIISIFANATHYLERYFEQMDALQKLLGRGGLPMSLTLVLGYGDSTDNTGAALWDETVNRFDARLFDVSHGGKVYGSIEHPLRFKQLAAIGNKLLDNVPESADVVGIVESDLIWHPETMQWLICGILAGFEAIAPMVLDGENSFYDVFAFRKNGVRFTKEPPYHPALREGGMVPVDSAGSVLFVRADLARKARLSDEEAIVGFCAGIREQGGSIYLDTQASVAHFPLGGKQPQRSAVDSRRAQELLRL